jgi:hypothetical protein
MAANMLSFSLARLKDVKITKNANSVSAGCKPMWGRKKGTCHFEGS